MGHNSKAMFPGFSNSTSRSRPLIALLAFVVLALFLLAFRSSSKTPSARLYQASSQSHLVISRKRQQLLDTIGNVTLGFEKILAINLPERSDYSDRLALAAAVSDIKVDIVDGVHGDDVLEKVLPPKHRENPDATFKGSWRAHINALRRVVENNWATALIFEADVDWDIRVRNALTNIALASEAVISHPGLRQIDLSKLSFHGSAPVSPYGDGWDVLWLGHCGMQVKDESTVVVVNNDETVPEAKFVTSWNSDETSPLANFPPHARIVSEMNDGVCTIGYAVTQSGARQLLNSLGLHRMNNPFDLMLREWCAGEEGDNAHVCLGTLPPVFASHRPAGSVAGDSDMHETDSGWRDRGFTQNIRWSVQMNMDKILRGNTEYEDQFPETDL